MSFFDSLILGILQGITEFLPISSSGHLILAEDFLGLDTADLKSFDVLMHMGTFLAIAVYFWRDIWEMLKAFVEIIQKRNFKNPYARLILWIFIGTIPAVIVGKFAGKNIDEIFRSSDRVAMNLIAIALVFLLAEYIYKKCFKEKKGIEKLDWKNSLAIGFAQALALIPGVSRSGATISMGLLQGIERASAARFSFLLGLPAMLGAALLTSLETNPSDIYAVGVSSLLTGFLSSFIAGILSIFFLMKFLRKHSLVWFAAYRIILAIFVLAYY